MSKTIKILSGSIRALAMFLLAVSIISLAVSVAYADEPEVGSPEAAEKAALQEIERMKETGLLSQDVSFEGNADCVYEIEETQGDGSWYGRLFSHSYDVRWYGGKYSGNINIDAGTGKVAYLSIEAAAEDADIPERTEEIEIPAAADPDKTETVTLSFYSNYDDIFPTDLTVDSFCDLLAEYWGFGEHTLSDTAEWFYGGMEAADGNLLLKDMPLDNYYLTVFFEGDQEGAPMYMELAQLPGRVCLLFGTRHMVV